VGQLALELLSELGSQVGLLKLVLEVGSLLELVFQGELDQNAELEVHGVQLVGVVLLGNELNDPVDNVALALLRDHVLGNKLVNLAGDVHVGRSELHESAKGVLVPVAPDVGDWELVGELESEVLGEVLGMDDSLRGTLGFLDKGAGNSLECVDHLELGDWGLAEC
jgi:hypothetical protein